MDTIESVKREIQYIDEEIETKKSEIEKLKDEINDLKVKKINLLQIDVTDPIFDTTGHICKDYIYFHPKKKL